jgi:hypothetical protein
MARRFHLRLMKLMPFGHSLSARAQLDFGNPPAPKGDSRAERGQFSRPMGRTTQSERVGAKTLTVCPPFAAPLCGQREGLHD